MVKCFLAIILWLGLSLAAQSQDIAYRQLRPGSESPLSEVYGRIVQDSAGHIWAGGVRGLYRFDGTDWQNFPRQEVIRDVECIDLQLAENQILWYTNASRQTCYLPVNGDSIRSPYQDSYWQSLSSPYLVLYRDQVMVAPREGSVIRRYYRLRKDSVPELLQEQLGEWRLGNFRYDSQGRRYYIRINRNAAELYLNDAGRDSLLGSFIGEKMYSIELLQPVLGSDVIFVYPYKSPKDIFYLRDTKLYALPDWSDEDFTECYEVFSDHAGNYWLTTDRGFYGYNNQMEPLFDGQPLAKDYVIHNLFQDRDGAYWLGTKRSGILFVPNLETRRYSVDNSSLSSDQIVRITPGPEASFFIGTGDGSVYYCSNGQLVDRLTIGQNLGQNEQVDYLYFDGESLHFAIRNRGNYQAKLVNQKLQLVAGVDLGFAHLAAYRDQETDLTYYATDWGIRVSGSRNMDVNSKRFTALQADRFSDRIWAGGNYGLGYMPLSSSAGEQYSVKLLPHSLFVTDMVQTDDGLLWVATTGQGIFVLREEEIVDRWTRERGLSSNNCRQLTVGPNGKIWVATDLGVNRIDRAAESVKVIGESQGLINQLVLSLHLDEQHLWAGTEEGLFQIPLTVIDQPQRELPAPKISLQAENGNAYDTKASVVIKHSQNDLTLGFRSLSYLDQQHLAYRYRLIGLDSSWTTVSASMNNASFPGLGPGRYQFQVAALRTDTGQESRYEQLSFRIQAPFWRKPWFIGLGLLAIIGSSVLVSGHIRKLRYSRKIKQESYERRITNLRTRALRLQMNPHFVYNTMNAVFLAQMDKERSSALRIINRYGQLFRSVFEHAERETIELREEIEFLSIYLEMEQLRFSDRISVVFTPDDQLRNSKLQIPPMLIQPLVENAFKHGLFHKEGKGCLKVSLVENGDQLTVCVEDDGVGRQYSQKLSRQRRNGRSVSSENILRERIEIFNSRANSPGQHIQFKVEDLYNDEGEASGTLAQLTIPLMKMKHL